LLLDNPGFIAALAERVSQIQSRKCEKKAT